MSVLYNDVQKGRLKARNAKVLKLKQYVTIKKSMTEYHY